MLPSEGSIQFCRFLVLDWKGVSHRFVCAISCVWEVRVKVGVVLSEF